MIQRKQTIYLLLAVVLLVVSCFMPLGYFMETSGATTTSLKPFSAVSWQLGALLSLSALVDLVAVFLFHKHQVMMQVRMCVFALLLIVGYYVSLAVLLFVGTKPEVLSEFHISMFLAFPLCAFILTIMARAAINKDINAYKSMDRIR